MTSTPEPPVPRRWRPSPYLGFSLGLHAGAAGWAAATPSHWPWAAGLVLANHVSLAVAGILPGSRLLGPNLSRLPEPTEGRAALTFDDGPDPRATPRVLDLLAERGARATFFLIGERAEAHPEIVAEIAGRGHRVENHSHTHPHGFAFYPPPWLSRELDRAQETLARLAGRRPRLFRAPAGTRNPLLDPLLARRGLQLASWSRRGFDAVDRDARRVARRLTRNLGAGDVLLLHDGTTLGGDRQTVVLEVLPRVLDALAEHGLRAVPLETGPLEAGP